MRRNNELWYFERIGCFVGAFCLYAVQNTGIFVNVICLTCKRLFSTFAFNLFTIIFGVALFLCIEWIMTAAAVLRFFFRHQMPTHTDKWLWWLMRIEHTVAFVIFFRCSFTVASSTWIYDCYFDVCSFRFFGCQKSVPMLFVRCFA